MKPTHPMHIYEVRRPRKDKRGVDLISDALPFGRLWYDKPNAIETRSVTRCTKPICRCHNPRGAHCPPRICLILAGRTLFSSSRSLAACWRAAFVCFLELSVTYGSSKVHQP